MLLTGQAAHFDHRLNDDHWEQPGNLFRLMTSTQRQVLFANTARAMGDAKLQIKQRHIANCTRADPAYGASIAKALELEHSALAAE
jgi:catalase